MSIIIHPYEGIEIEGKGTIRFGMSREEIRSFFDEEPKELTGYKQEMTGDAYYQASLQFEYKQPGILTGIALAQDQDTLFQGKRIFQTTYGEIKRWFQELDPNAEIEMYEGLTSYDFGISFWTPNEEELGYIPESVFVFEKGYYNK